MRLDDRFNAIVNHPDVLPYVAPGLPYVDARHYIHAPKNVCMLDDYGAALFVYEGPGVYTGHYLYTRRKKGKAAKDFSHSALSLMFDVIHADSVLGQVAETNLACRIMSRALGCKPVGRSVDSYGRSCINYLLERQTWAAFSEASSRALAA